MKNLILLLLAVLSTSINQAQTIRGTVKEKNGDPLVGAYVSHSASGHHEHTDIRGNFKMDGVSQGDTLVVSYVGFETKKVAVKSLSDALIIPLDIKVNLLSEVRIAPRADLSDLIGDIDMVTRPVDNSQLVLRKVPGLFIAQHAGGGKAEQIFLRGFDIDHGTDVAINIDGMPVNMVSHAHGQGYADMHFIIAETIDRIDFDKGGYRADRGNFSTAGSISLRRKDRLEQSMLKLEGGQFNTSRVVGMFSLTDTKTHGGYLAIERMGSDGPFTSPQDLIRTNVEGHYDIRLNNGHHLDLGLSHFISSWDASGQIPQRAIDSGMIDRWGAIDDTEGGETGRTDVQLSLTSQLTDRSQLRNRFSASHYHFQLFSNFTFFLAEPEFGDQIMQQEDRMLYAWNSEYKHQLEFGNWDSELTLGLDWRYDEIDGSELSRTVGRDSLLSRLSYADMEENDQALYAELRLAKGRFSLTPGLRYDRFQFVRRNRIGNPIVKQNAEADVFSPKLRMDYLASNKMKYYLHLGQSFHSNDMRMVMDRGSRAGALPSSSGADLGFTWKPDRRVFLQMAAWYLYLEQEFVYVGDEAVVEASGETQRSGLDLSTRVLLTEHLVFDLDATYSYARGLEDEGDDLYIPLAPEWTATGGITYTRPSGLAASVYARYLGDRPADEIYDVTAEGYTIVDLDLSYSWERVRLSLSMDNILDTEWKEAQFLTQSRLPGEAAEGVEEIHFTPGTPRAIYGGISLLF